MVKGKKEIEELKGDVEAKEEEPPAVRALKVLFELLMKRKKNEDRKPVLLQEAL